MLTDVSKEIVTELQAILDGIYAQEINIEDARKRAQQLKDKHLQYWDGGELETEFDLIISMTTIGRVPSDLLEDFLTSIQKDLDRVKQRLGL